MTQADFTALARRLLIENGRPMTRGQLLKRLKEIGRGIGGQDEMKNLGTKLWRARDTIVNVPGAGYWPLEIDCPAVGYHAPSQTAAVSQTSAPASMSDSPDETYGEMTEVGGVDGGHSVHSLFS